MTALLLALSLSSFSSVANAQERDGSWVCFCFTDAAATISVGGIGYPLQTPNVERQALKDCQAVVPATKTVRCEVYLEESDLE